MFKGTSFPAIRGLLRRQTSPVSSAAMIVQPDYRGFCIEVNAELADVSVIDTTTNTVTRPPIPVGNRPLGVAIMP
jgi:YVTN family beta-propeller protein